MKTLSIDEASSNLARWLQLALAGEEIGILSGSAIVALRPAGSVAEPQGQPPREALRLLQRDARLTASKAADYLRELREERLAAEDRRPA